MFSFFSKKPKFKRLDDKVYVERSAADRAVIADALRSRSEMKEVFILYYFNSTLDRLQAIEGVSGSNLVKAEKLLNDIATRNPLRTKNSPVFLFAEHFPDWKHEHSIMLEIEQLCEGKGPSIGFYAGLDEPMMRLFGAERIISLVKRMGLKEDEAISHGMVTQSIERAQKKISEKVPSPVSAHSQEEWVKINLPDLHKTG